jgi:hypothetical protein
MLNAILVYEYSESYHYCPHTQALPVLTRKAGARQHVVIIWGRGPSFCQMTQRISSTTAVVRERTEV